MKKNHYDLRVDIKNGILNRPDKTLSRTDCNDDPSNGKAPQTRTYNTTPSDCKIKWKIIIIIFVVVHVTK